MTQTTKMTRWYLEDEDSDAYRQHYDRVLKTINPQDVFEEMWVQDIVDHSWEIRRLRYIKQSLLENALHRGLQEVLTPIMGAIPAMTLSKRWQAKDADAIEQVEALLSGAELDMGMVRAETVALRINEIEKIEHRIFSAEVRRDRAVRDIECHKFGFGERLKSEATKFIEATVEPEDIILLEASSS